MKQRNRLTSRIWSKHKSRVIGGGGYESSIARLPLGRAVLMAAFLAGLVMTSAGLKAQTAAFINLADGPFSPGGFNNIGSATATSLFDSRNGLLTIEVDPANPERGQGDSNILLRQELQFFERRSSGTVSERSF